MFKQFTIHSIDKCSQLYHEAKLFNGNIYRLRFWQDLARFKIIKCLNAQHIINILHMCHLGFPVDETFREKMRKFSFSFCKLFREKFAKKICEFFFRENFVKTMNVTAATINCSKKLVEKNLIPQYLKFYHVILIILNPLF